MKSVHCIWEHSPYEKYIIIKSENILILRGSKLHALTGNIVNTPHFEKTMLPNLR